VFAPVTMATRPLWSGISLVVHLPSELIEENDTHPSFGVAVSVQFALASVALS
jgi:hypothetical protein